MAGEVGVDAADGNRLGFLLGCAGGPEQGSADAREAVGLNDGHGFLASRPHRERVLLLVSGGHGLKATDRWQ